MKKIVIIMPTYKEKDNIAKMVPALFDTYFPSIKADMHLLVVNDLPGKGQPDDGTGKLVRSYQKKYKQLHLLEDVKQGLGWAYIRGMKHALGKLQADAVMEMDADFQHPPRFVEPMVRAYLDGADYVIGSRYIKGGSVPKEWDTVRKLISYFGNLFIRIVLVKPKLHDLTTGFRLTGSSVLEKIKLDDLMEPHRFAYKVDLLYQSIKNAKKVVEVPLEFASRTEEVSKFSMQEMVSTFKVAIILGIKDKERFIKYGIVGFIGYLINATGLYLLGKSGVPEWVAWAGSTEMAIISNFVLNNVWTFKAEQISGVAMVAKKFVQFNGASLGALLIQTVAGTIGVAIFGTEYRQILLPFIIAFLVIPYNYFMYNVFIWKTWKTPKLLRFGK